MRPSWSRPGFPGRAEGPGTTGPLGPESGWSPFGICSGTHPGHLKGANLMFKRTNAWLAVLGLLIVAAAGFAARGLVAQPAATAASDGSSSGSASGDTAFVEVVLDELSITPSTI